MKYTLYEKVGRKYKPVQEYDSRVMDAMPYGFHLVHIRNDGGRSYRLKIDPADVEVLAACSKLRDAMLDAMNKAAELELKPELKKNGAWMKAYNEFHEKTKNTIEGKIIGRYNSRTDLVDAAIKVIDDALRKQ